MDWVETTGKSIEEATDRALAHLGVHRDDAEVEVMEEPKAGLFGRVRGDINSIMERDPAARSWLEILLCYPGLHAVWSQREDTRSEE